MSEERFDRIDATLEKLGAGFNRLEGSVTTLQVQQEAMSEQFKVVRDGIAATNERLDRFELQVNERFDQLTVDIRMVLDNHEVRIHDLEQR